MNCPYCEIEINDYESHEKSNFTSKESLSCNNCDLVIPNEECLERHKKIVHDISQKIFSCELCNIDFSAKKYLFIHKNIGHKITNIIKEEIEPFDIKVEIEETNDSNLENSNSIIDENSIKQCSQSKMKDFKCSECYKTFSSKWNLILHKRHVHQNL